MTAASRSPDQHVYDYLARLESEAAGRDDLRSETNLQSATNEAYKGARINRLNKSWQPQNRSGDAAISESYDLLNSRTRDGIRNNPILSGAKQTLVDLIVGQGVNTYFEPPLVDDIERYFDYAMESDEEFLDWAENWADAEGRLSWFDMQRVAAGEVFETGDCFLLECHRSEPGRRVSLCYQLIEKELLDCSMDRPAGPKQNRICHGIEYDASNRPVAYHFFNAHPHDAHFAPGDYRSEPVPANRVIHLYWPSRPSAHVGVTWFHSLSQPTHDRDWLANATLTKAAISALLVGIIKRENPGAGQLGMDDGVDDTTLLNQPIKWGPGLMFEGGMNDSVEVIESKQPSQFSPELVEFIDHDIARGAGLSYVRATGRYKATSYTAARAAHLDDEARVGPVKRWFASRLLLQVRRRFNRLAVGLGLFQTLTARDFRKNERIFQKFEAIGPGREQLDPEKETEASVTKLRAGLSTLRHECGLRNKHWVRVLKQMRIEKQLASEYGITLDFSKGQGGRAEKTTTNADAA